MDNIFKIGDRVMISPYVVTYGGRKGVVVMIGNENPLNVMVDISDNPETKRLVGVSCFEITKID